MDKVGLVVVDEDGDDIGEPFDLTDEMRQNPQLILEEVDRIVKEYTTINEEDKEDEE